MEQNAANVTLKVSGMTCVNCEKRIEELSKEKGIYSVKASYARGTVEISYNEEAIGREHILRRLEALGYPEKVGGDANGAGILLLVFAGYLLLRRMGLLDFANAFPLAEAGMSYGALFVTGLLTSVHCVAMCGGINLSQCLPGDSSETGGGAYRHGLLYNLGRVLSYTAVGAVVGAVGSVISFSTTAQGVVQLLAGAFMVLMGLNMLGLLPWLRLLRGKLPSGFACGVRGKLRGRGPLAVGLLNGLMPCGPLQAMQLYALSTGSPLKGALSMLLFSLGTVPLMFGLGAASSWLGQKNARRVLSAGAALVAVLGISMFGNGLALAGIGSVPAGGAAAAASTGAGVQVVNTQLSPRGYPAITVQKGIPVRWIIEAEQRAINGCNNRLLIREYGIEKALQPGENIIEFTPSESGVFSYSCWMGMIRSTITVTEDGQVPEPEPNGISTDAVAVATVEGSIQRVEIAADSGRFTPAVVVLQYGVEAQWIIDNSTQGLESLLLPLYNMELQLKQGENGFVLIPTASFGFSSGDGEIQGYVKVVDSLQGLDLEDVKAEAAAYQPLEQNFNAGCCSAQ